MDLFMTCFGLLHPPTEPRSISLLFLNPSCHPTAVS